MFYPWLTCTSIFIIGFYYDMHAVNLGGGEPVWVVVWYWSDQKIWNCSFVLPNMRLRHTINIELALMTVAWWLELTPTEIYVISWNLCMYISGSFVWLPIGNLLVLYMVTSRTSEYHYQHARTMLFEMISKKKMMTSKGMKIWKRTKCILTLIWQWYFYVILYTYVYV